MAVLYITGAILVTFSALVNGDTPHARQEDPTQVLIPQGLLQGKELRSREGKTFYAFMGVPYAQMPEVLEEAFYPPPSWEGTYDATNYGSLCLQVNRTTGQVEGDEDCLMINSLGNMSVLAYIHGGGFRSAWAPENGPEFLLDHDVIFVTFSYRLAALGFLSTGDGALPGNLGLKDQNLALRWIQDNIGYFGGSKNKVTLFGESAGSTSVSLHIVSPLSAGIFQQAICQSGSSIDCWATVENPLQLAIQVAERLSCPTSPTADVAVCLKNKTAEEIIAVEIPSSKFGTGVVFGLVVETGNSPDSQFLVEQPDKIYEEGRFNKVPLIITINEIEGLVLSALCVLIDKEALDEMNNNWDSVAQDAFIIDKESYSNASKLWATTKIREHYFGSRLVGNETLINLTNAYTDALFMYTAKKTALAHAKYAPVYTTMLTFKGIWSQTFPYGFTQVLGMTHADDLQYLFTNWRYPDFPPGSEVETFSKLVTRIWVEYADTGEPNYNLNGRKWVPVTDDEIISGKVTWLVLGNQPAFVEEPVKERMILWDHIEDVLETGIVPRV